MDDSWQDVGDRDQEEVEDKYLSGLKEFEQLGLVDIGPLASWEVSSSKANCSIDQLRDDSPSTFWQSDGAQPHHLDIHFSKRVNVTRISLYLDYLLDESYTPSHITINAGTGFHDLTLVREIHLEQPTGWSHLCFETGLKTFLIRISIIANHQHGKDTHIRGVRIFAQQGRNELEGSTRFTSLKLISESTIR